jgi:hypothetical protein
MSKIIFLLLLILVGCATPHVDKSSITQKPIEPVKEFSAGELILGSQLLTKIFDKEMASLSCVPDTDEASLLLRTIRPRMEVVQDDMEAALDDDNEIGRMVQDCNKNCTCGYVDDLLREHLVTLSKAQRKSLNAKKSDKEINRCLSFIQSTFCQSELYQQLNKEKSDFSFEEAP